jgi:Protein of unknown function (DUF669)
MPIPTNYKLPEKAKFELLPEDKYEVEITDVEVKENKVYQKEETEDVFNFTFAITKGEYKGRILWQNARMIMSAGWDKGNPSTLYRIYCAATGKKISPDETAAVTADMINGTIGKKLAVVVSQKPKQDGTLKNVITNFLEVKQSVEDKNLEEIGDGLDL